MRNFAAATVMAVAAALIAASALVVSIVGAVESLGSLAGRTSVEITDLPYGLTKAQHVDRLRVIAEDADVALAMLVPDRSDRVGAWTAYTFRRTPAMPVFRGELDVRPVGDGGVLDIRTTFAVDGTDRSIATFLSSIGTSGYEFSDVTPSPLAVLLLSLERPTTLIAALATVAGVVVALVAEAVRRGPRQSLRTTVGWSRRHIAAREAAEIGALVAALGVVMIGAFTGFLWSQEASWAVSSFTYGDLFTVAGAAVAVIVVAHVACNLWGGSGVVGARGTRSLRPLVCGAALTLVVLVVIDVRTVAVAREDAVSLEQTLKAEALHGDDVVLGTNFTGFERDVSFGSMALEPLLRGEASMAQSSFVDHFTVVGAASASLDAFADEITRAAPDSGPVLLVPAVLGLEADAVRATARTALRDGWEVEGRNPPNDLDVRAVIVPSTATITESIVDWTGAAPSVAPTWPDIPVLVVQDPSQIALNRIGTAVANGEVRFTDQQALERSIVDDGLADSVLQVRRVGATVEAKLVALRTERSTAEALVFATVLVLVFSSYTLTVDHRQRTRRTSLLRYIVGRHAIVRHRSFVISTVTMTVVVVVTTDVVLGASIMTGLADSLVAGVLLGTLLTGLLIITGQRERNVR